MIAANICNEVTLYLTYNCFLSFGERFHTVTGFRFHFQYHGFNEHEVEAITMKISILTNNCFLFLKAFNTTRKYVFLKY